MTEKSDLMEMAAAIVSAYVGNNSLAPDDVPGLIQEVYLALVAADSGDISTMAERGEPAVPVRKSITPDYLICLEDGKQFKSLKRHLRAHYDMSPDEYRAKWDLPSDYPMVAPNYAQARSKLAKKMGLGQQGRKTPRKSR
ncbi:MAG: MucR family transcriptional regulator [Rhizobiales bacterium]|nr:MucR family transcriptional regulator [Hyphomicrobiales bacterium]